MVAVAVLAVSMAVGCVGKTRTYTDAEQAINVGINEEFYIALNAGYDITSAALYDWWVNYDHTMLSLADSWWGQKTESKTEALGTRWFRFKALKKGKTEITMDHVCLSFNLNHTEHGPFLDKQIFTVNIK